MNIYRNEASICKRSYSFNKQLERDRYLSKHADTMATTDEQSFNFYWGRPNYYWYINKLDNFYDPSFDT